MNLTLQIHGLLLNPLSNHDALLQLLLCNHLESIISRSPDDFSSFTKLVLQSFVNTVISMANSRSKSAQLQYSRAKPHAWVTVLTTQASFLFCLDWKLSVLNLNGYSKHFSFRRKCMTLNNRVIIILCRNISNKSVG